MADEVRDALADLFIRRAATTAERIRALADTIEQRAEDVRRVGSPGIDSAGVVAAGLVHRFTADIGACGLDGVVAAAAEFDRGVG